MFPKIRKKLLLVVLASIVLISLGAYHTTSFTPFINFTVDFTSSGFEQHDKNTREQLHFSQYKFSLTDQLEADVGGWDKFAAKSQSDKCLTFFKLIDTKLPDWEVSTLGGRLFDKSVVKKGNYFNSELDKIKKRKGREKPPGEITDEDKSKVNENFLKALKDTMTTEQEMADTMTIIRLFGHCFLKEASAHEGELGEIYKRYSWKIVPFFNPVIPQISSGHVETNSEWQFGAKGSAENVNILDYYHKNMQGTGIVLSTATRHSRDVVKFIHVLRALRNTFPVEILYRSDLSMKSKQAILLAGSSSKEELLGDEMTDENVILRALETAGLKFSDLEDLPLPKQSITLINMQTPLANIGRNDFASYNNKILALFFNSFEKVLLFDADVVPLLSPESLTALNEFTSTGAYLFRDRTLLDRNDWIETNYFAKLMPHETSKVDMAMGVKPVTSHTMENPYMKGWRHCQEAGLVMLDRKRHFSSLLALFPLALWGEPVKSSIWGDKEMYWLSMSMVGDEDYTLNHYGAASVGELTPEPNLKHYNNCKAHELCSSHPGHVSTDGRLLWINSGFSYCKKNGYARDKSRFPFSLFENKDSMKSLYENPLKIRHAISPPELPALRTPDGSPDLTLELDFISAFKSRKKDVDQMSDVDQISTYEPQKGWIKSRTCSDYQYCAYNAFESLDGSGALDESGSWFQFGPEDYKRYDILGAIWVSSIRVSSLTHPPKNPKIKVEVAPASGNDLPEKPQLSTEKKPGTENSIHDDLKVVNHAGGVMDPALASEKTEEEKNKDIESGSQVNSDNDVGFDPSKVKHRPEAFREDVKGALSKLLSYGNQA